MSHRTQKEIETEIKNLENAKSYAPHYTAFGDDNHAGIDAQIKALKNDWDEDDAYDYFDGDNNEQSLVDAAREAIEWRDGDSNEAPSAGWDSYRK